MFKTKIGKEYDNDYIEEKFKTAYKFLHRKDLADLAEGAVELGQGVTAYIQRYKTSPAEKLRFETHDKFYDVQYMAYGREMFGLASRESLTIEADYNEKKEITYYNDPVNISYLLLEEGDFIIVGPDEAHKPRVAADLPMDVVKVVVKVPVK